MTPYDFECPVHGRVEIRRPMAEAGLPAFCPTCLIDYNGDLPQPMRRVWVPVLVQNHSVSDEQGGNLRSFGQHERLVKTNINDWIASERRRRLERESDK